MAKDKAILPISYFGPIRYYTILNTYDVCLEQHENYQKRTIRNRTKILSSNGILTLSVPLQRGKTLTNIKATKISYDEPWQATHLKGIRSAYSSAPYFDYYFDAIAELLSASYVTLFELDMATIKYVESLGLIAPMRLSSSYEHSYAGGLLDMRAEAKWTCSKIRPYIQVFEAKYGFIANLSILDALFNLGPETSRLLSE